MMYILLILILVIAVFIFIRLKAVKPKEKLRFINLNEYNSKLFNDLANDNIQFGNNEKAIYYFTKAVELEPERFEFYLNRGNLYSKLNSLSLAVIDWETAARNGSTEATKILEKYKIDQLTQIDENLNLENTLNDFGIRFIYHMTHKSNLENILVNGLLSHNSAHKQKLTRTDISDLDVNSRREKVHDYVPFYFNPKNPMLYKRKSIQTDIIILCFDRNLLKNELMFTDGNAASNSTNFFTKIKDLGKLNWSIINSEYWSDFIDGKRIRCSEVLIPNKVGINYLKKVICNDAECYSYISKKLQTENIKAEINADFYFS